MLAASRLVQSGAAGEPDAHDVAGALLRGCVALHLAGTLLDVDYQATHESDATGWLRLSFFTEGLYQQLHAVTTIGVMLVDSAYPPATGRKSLAGLLDSVDHSPEHPLSERVAAARRELDLLRWLCTVRNKAIQHRAEEGYTGGRGVIMPSRFALLTAADPPAPEAIDWAILTFQTLSQTFGPWDLSPPRSREAITYLDFASHELMPADPEHFDIARRAVEGARVYDVVVSPPMFENTDAALSHLIALADPSTD